MWISGYVDVELECWGVAVGCGYVEEVNSKKHLINKFANKNNSNYY